MKKERKLKDNTTFRKNGLVIPTSKFSLPFSMCPKRTIPVSFVNSFGIPFVSLVERG